MNGLRLRLLGNRRKENQEDRIRVMLKNIPIFDGLSKRELLAVERILHKREYQPDEVIFRQEEPGMGMYIIESGTVEIVAEPSQIQLSELTDGEFFGELAILDESPRSATARSKTQCTIFGFFQPDLFSLIERNPRLGVKIVMRLARIIGERLRKANERTQRIRKEFDQPAAGLQ